MRVRVIIVIILSIFAALFIIPLIGILINLWQNNRAKDMLVQALREEFPDLKFWGAVSYERPVVYIQFHGVSDPRKQAEIRDWIVKFKVERGIGRRVRLAFFDTKTDDEPVYEINSP